MSKAVPLLLLTIVALTAQAEPELNPFAGRVHEDGAADRLIIRLTSGTGAPYDEKK